MKLALKAVVAALTVATIMTAASATEPVAKNVILMISDGMGYNAMKAADYYTGSTAIYESWEDKFFMQTVSANNTEGRYNPLSMAGSFTYANLLPTDSASAATAMYTGVKNYDGVINISTTGTRLPTYFEGAAFQGRSAGAISTVEFSHATPAAVFSHNSSRNNYGSIAAEAIYASPYADNIKVLMGAGHPLYNDNGLQIRTTANNTQAQFVGGAGAWADMADGVANGKTVIQTLEQFNALTTGETPDKVIGVAQAATTLQQGRTAGALANTNVPTLATMTRGALNVLDNNANGFALMIEGGAIDWAGHANQMDRIIEEQIDFNNAVQAVVDWVDANNKWSETLLIVTADHETGFLMGNDASTGFFDVDGDGIFTVGKDYAQLVDKGEGNLPGGKFWSGNHTNQLIPLFAKGAGADLFASKVIGTDTNIDEIYGLDSSWTGQYIDNTSIFNVMVEASGVPEPATMALLAIGGVAAIIRRRRA
jgi:alkaline phosphatase